MPRIIICLGCGERKEYYAKGMCGPCYKRQWNEETNYYRRYDQGRREERKAYKRQYHLDNREKILAKGREWREENPDYHREYDRKRREENPDEYKEYYWANWEKEKERGRRYREENPEKVNARSRKWRRNNSDYFVQYREEHREQDHARKARRRARKDFLPDTLTSEGMRELLKIGQGTYPNEKLHLDHFVPLGRRENVSCGTTRANMHYIPAEINRWKHNKLPKEFLVQLSLLV